MPACGMNQIISLKKYYTMNNHKKQLLISKKTVAVPKHPQNKPKQQKDSRTSGGSATAFAYGMGFTDGL